jgi:hypothetical protein
MVRGDLNSRSASIELRARLRAEPLLNRRLVEAPLSPDLNRRDFLCFGPQAEGPDRDRQPLGKVPCR